MDGFATSIIRRWPAQDNPERGLLFMTRPQLGVKIGETGMNPHGEFEQYLRLGELCRKIGAVHGGLVALKYVLSTAVSIGELAYVEQRLPEYERLMSTLSDPSDSMLDLNRLKVDIAASQGHLWEALHLAQDLEAEISERYSMQFQCKWYCTTGEIILELHRLGEAVDLAAAEDALSEAIRISNQIGEWQVRTHCQLCIFHARQGRAEEAALFLNKAGEFAGQSPTIRDQMWLKYAQAELSTTKKRWDEAIEAFDISSRLLTQAELRPMLAQVLTQKADARIARAEPSDLDTARTLLLEAQSIYEYMGSTVYLEFVKQKLEGLAES
jgi:tetratricopeptide (TPR) repeat protein